MSQMHGNKKFESVIIPTVTVVIPCYNVFDYIDRCILSVVKQSYDDFEIILIDDGSTDRTFEKCSAWKKRDSRITLVSKKNLGLGSTRNLGISMAQSEYVTFLDADDWWHEDYLKEMMTGTENGKNDLVVCDFNFVNEGCGESLTQTSALRLPNGTLDKRNTMHLLSRARTQACGKMYRRGLFMDNDVKEPHHAYEDVATTPYLVAVAASIYHVPKALYFYVRNREGSIINHFPSLEDLLLSLAELAERFKRDNLFEAYYHQLRRIFWGELCFLYRMLNTKFAASDEKKATALRNECEKIVYGVFPELKNLAKMRFYVSNDEVLAKAVRCVVLQREQIVRDASYLREFDIAVCATRGALPKDFDGEVIWVTIPASDTADPERPIWDLADNVFDAVCEGKRLGV